MCCTGWIDEATSEVSTSMLIYSPRKDVFVHNDIKFTINGEGAVKSSYITKTIQVTDARSEFSVDGGGYDLWTAFRTWMSVYAVAFIIRFLIEMCSVCHAKNCIEKVVPDDPGTPENDAYLFCRPCIAPWVGEQVLLDVSLQRANPALWPTVGEDLDDPSATLGQVIHVPWSLRRQFGLQRLASRLLTFAIFALYYAAEYYWFIFQKLVKNREKRCLLSRDYLQHLRENPEEKEQFFGDRIFDNDFVGPDSSHRTYQGERDRGFRGLT